MDTTELEITAELAKIELNSAEIEKLGEEITQILVYFEKMMEVDVENLVPTTHAMVKENRIRNDVLVESPCVENILQNVPDKDDNFILIPRIL